MWAGRGQRSVHRVLSVHHHFMLVKLWLVMVHRHTIVHCIRLWSEVAVLPVVRTGSGVVIEKGRLTHGQGRMHRV